MEEQSISFCTLFELQVVRVAQSKAEWMALCEILRIHPA